jgi:hypothetical protein
MSQKLSHSQKLHFFPNIRPHNHSITSEETVGKKVIYNCVGWAALADTKKWWEAGNGPDYYWPAGVLDDGSLQSYEELFAFFGYRPCSSERLEIAYEKISLYSDAAGFTHVAYQLFYGWTSKLGGWEDIRHKSLSALEGGDYGTATTIMRRRSGIRGYMARAFFNFTALIWPLKRPPQK